MEYYQKENHCLSQKQTVPQILFSLHQQGFTFLTRIQRKTERTKVTFSHFPNFPLVFQRLSETFFRLPKHKKCQKMRGNEKERQECRI